MKAFEANRLSDGNKIMPNKISIDDFGVTLRIPGVFSGQEKTLTYHEISSVNIETPLVGFSTITFNTIGWDDLVAKGFSKEDAIEVKRFVQLGISTTRGGSSYGDGGLASAANHILAEAEAEKIRHQIEMEKNAAEAKSDKEFLEAAIKYWKIWVPFLAIIIGACVFFYTKQDNAKQEANKINLQLEQIEDKLKFAIQDGDRDKALDLTNQLVHPTHEIWEEKRHFFAVVYFDEYWSKKREEYKNQIMNMSKK